MAETYTETNQTTAEREQQRRARFEIPEHEPRSTSDLIKELRDQATLLVRQEAALAQSEMAEKAKRAARQSASIGAGAAMAFAGFMFLLLAATGGIVVGLAFAGLGLIYSLWLAPLITGLVVCLIGYAMIQGGVSNLKRQKMTPEKTRRTLQEDAQWLREKIKR